MIVLSPGTFLYNFRKGSNASSLKNMYWYYIHVKKALVAKEIRPATDMHTMKNTFGKRPHAAAAVGCASCEC